MFGTVLSPLVERGKVLLAARAVQELEGDFVAGAAGRPAALEKLAAAWQSAGLDGAAADLQRRGRALAATGNDTGAGGPAAPPPPAVLPLPGRKPRR